MGLPRLVSLTVKLLSVMLIKFICGNLIICCFAIADKYRLIIGILYMNKYVFCFLSSFNCYKNIGIVDSLNINIVYQAGRAVR